MGIIDNLCVWRHVKWKRLNSSNIPKESDNVNLQGFLTCKWGFNCSQILFLFFSWWPQSLSFEIISLVKVFSWNSVLHKINNQQFKSRSSNNVITNTAKDVSGVFSQNRQVTFKICTCHRILLVELQGFWDGWETKYVQSFGR